MCLASIGDLREVPRNEFGDASKLNSMPIEAPIKGDSGKVSRPGDPVHIAALLVLGVGAIASVGFTLQTGHRNKSTLLIALFVAWVLSPFVALAWANAVSRHWSGLTRVALNAVTFLLPVISAAIYGTVALGAPRAKPAFLFLVVPLASWFLVAMTVPLGMFVSGRRARQGSSV
jgi:hypothetical protein